VAFFFFSTPIFSQVTFGGEPVTARAYYKIQMGRFSSINMHHPFYNTKRRMSVLIDRTTEPHTYVVYLVERFDNRQRAMATVRKLEREGYMKCFLVEEIVFMNYLGFEKKVFTESNVYQPVTTPNTVPDKKKDDVVSYDNDVIYLDDDKPTIAKDTLMTIDTTATVYPDTLPVLKQLGSSRGPIDISDVDFDLSSLPKRSEDF
jgi:hypothetical protein